MGLEIMVLDHPEFATAVSNYRGVHTMRRSLINSAKKWCHLNDYQTLYHELGKWVKVPEGKIFNNVNYPAIPHECPYELGDLGLAGLYWFVNHSDCDGRWTYGQCCDIIQFYDMMVESDCLAPLAFDRRPEVMNVIRKACELRKSIVFF